jgi:hypothetical protein
VSYSISGLRVTDEPELEAGPLDGAAPHRSGRGRTRLPILTGGIIAEDRALPLAGRDRAAWRVISVLLCLASCRGRSATVEQLHVLSWAIRDEENGRVLASVWNQEDGAPRLLRAWDPKLEDTLHLARAAELVEQKNTGRYVLTTAGTRVVRALRSAQPDVLSKEQQFLAVLGSLTESGMWDRLGRRSSGSARERQARRGR